MTFLTQILTFFNNIPGGSQVRFSHDTFFFSSGKFYAQLQIIPCQSFEHYQRHWIYCCQSGRLGGNTRATAAAVAHLGLTAHLGNDLGCSHHKQRRSRIHGIVHLTADGRNQVTVPPHQKGADLGGRVDRCTLTTVIGSLAYGLCLWL